MELGQEEEDENIFISPAKIRRRDREEIKKAKAAVDTGAFRHDRDLFTIVSMGRRMRSYLLNSVIITESANLNGPAELRKSHLSPCVISIIQSFLDF